MTLKKKETIMKNANQKKIVDEKEDLKGYSS